MTQIAYNKIPWYRQKLDEVAINNKSIFKLSPILNEAYDEEKYKQICNETIVHKIQRRNKYIRKTDSNEITFFGYLYKLFEC